jgi:hypothetical protein
MLWLLLLTMVAITRAKAGCTAPTPALATQPSTPYGHSGWFSLARRDKGTFAGGAMGACEAHKQGSTSVRPQHQARHKTAAILAGAAGVGSLPVAVWAHLVVLRHLAGLGTFAEAQAVALAGLVV